MIKTEDVIKIGHFTKPHGIKGEIAFNFTSDIFDRCECAYLICGIDGILVPFFIEEYRFKSDTTALIKFEDVDTEEAAREFAGIEVFYPKEYMDEEELDDEYRWDYFVGFSVVDETYGDLGPIEAVDETTINILLQITRNGEEVLIPAAEELITGIDHDKRILYVQLPEGLVDMDSITDVC